MVDLGTRPVVVTKDHFDCYECLKWQREQGFALFGMVYQKTDMMAHSQGPEYAKMRPCCYIQVGPEQAPSPAYLRSIFEVR